MSKNIEKMAVKSTDFLKNQNRDFDNVIDSYLSLDSTSAQTQGGVVFYQDFAIASGSATGDNAYTGNAGVLTEAAHAGKTVLLPDANANATLQIPTPSKAGVTYKLVYHGVADDAHDMVISFADDAAYFKGSLLTLDEDLDGGATVATIFADGSTHDVLTINDPHTYCIEMVSLSTTQMAVWGYIVSDTVAAFSAAD